MNATINYWRFATHWIVWERTVCISLILNLLLNLHCWSLELRNFYPLNFYCTIENTRLEDRETSSSWRTLEFNRTFLPLCSHLHLSLCELTPVTELDIDGMLLAGTYHGRHLVCLPFLKSAETINNEILVPIATVAGEHTVDNLRLVTHHKERELCESFVALCLHLTLNLLVRVDVKLLVSQQLLKPLLWLLLMPSESVSIDSESCLFSIAYERCNSTEIHSALVVDT